MEKINGEAFHFSGRYLYDKFYWFVGSKRNHIMIGKESDIDLYTDERHQQAKKFAKSFMKLLNKISKDKLEILCNLLHYTKVTAICEILQPSYQHIVHIDGDDDKIVFLTFSSTYNNNNNNNNSLTAFPPHITCNVMEALNITTANYYEIPCSGGGGGGNGEKEMSEMEKIRSTENSEGMVLYYLNKNNETIGLLKLKTCWYIFLRALREQLSKYFNIKKQNQDTNIEEKINNRYDQLQSRLSLRNDQINEWKNIAKEFTNWLSNKQKSSTIIIEANDIKSKFPIFWKEFLSDSFFQ